MIDQAIRRSFLGIVSGRSNIRISCFIFWIPYQNGKTVLYLFCRQILHLFPKEGLRRSHTHSPVTQRHWKSMPFLQISSSCLVFITSLFQRPPDFSVENIMVWDVNKVQITTFQMYIYIYLYPTCTLQNVPTCTLEHFLNPRGKLWTHTSFCF